MDRLQRPILPSACSVTSSCCDLFMWSCPCFGRYSSQGSACIPCPMGGVCRRTVLLEENNLTISVGVTMPSTKPGFWLYSAPLSKVARGRYITPPSTFSPPLQEQLNAIFCIPRPPTLCRPTRTSPPSPLTAPRPPVSASPVTASGTLNLARRVSTRWGPPV